MTHLVHISKRVNARTIIVIITVFTLLLWTTHARRMCIHTHYVYPPSSTVYTRYYCYRTRTTHTLDVQKRRGKKNKRNPRKIGVPNFKSVKPPRSAGDHTSWYARRSAATAAQSDLKRRGSDDARQPVSRVAGAEAFTSNKARTITRSRGRIAGVCFKLKGYGFLVGTILILSTTRARPRASDWYAPFMPPPHRVYAHWTQSKENTRSLCTPPVRSVYNENRHLFDAPPLSEITVVVA